MGQRRRERALVELFARLDERQQAHERAFVERARTDETALHLAREIVDANAKLYEEKVAKLGVDQSALTIKIASWSGAIGIIVWLLSRYWK